MTTREEVRFTVEGGIELGAWLYLPQKGSGPGPAITMAHGYAGTREHGIRGLQMRSRLPGSSITGPLASVAGSRGRMSILGGRSPTGVELYPIGRRSTPAGSDFGERVTQVAIRSFWVRPIGGSLASSRRCRAGAIGSPTRPCLLSP
jgi:hypothetical protein